MTHAHLPLLLAPVLATAPVLAQQDVSKVNGGITAESSQTYRDTDTVNGGITLRDGTTAREVSTVNGGISAGDRIAVASLETVNGGISVGRDAKVRDDVETVNGGIFIDRGGVIGGDVETVNGAIGLVATEVGGSIETVRGDVTVGVDSRVRGGLRVQKSTGAFNNDRRSKPPRIVIGPNAVVEGPLVFEREVVLYMHQTARTGTITGAQAIRYDTAQPPKP